ncbi:MAG: N-acyl-D-amino-acid deacylase family protein [Candidatus Dormibacteria bacterium]
MRQADVLVADGRVAEVVPPGRLEPSSALVIDAAQQVVCPGFIDVHSHADGAPLLAEDDLTKILQGVTTDVVGNCGFSLAPVSDRYATELSALLGRLFPPIELQWRSVAELFAVSDAAGYVTNYAPLVGHNTIRLAVMGVVDRPPDPAELRAMARHLEEALTEGMFGLSSGLEYPPGMFAATDELLELARVLPADGIYTTHMRDEGANLLESISEALTVAEGASRRVQVSHLKSGGRANWGAIGGALGLLQAARAKGLAVGQDVYPYDAASTMLTASLPAWFQDGGDQALLARLRDRNALDRARVELSGGVVFGDGRDGVLIASTASHRYEGLTVRAVAELLSIDPFEALIRILEEEQLRATMIVFAMSEPDVEEALCDPATMVGSDGLPPGAGGRPHPRLFGTFPRVLGRYVRERKVLGLAAAIAKMTSLPADTFGLTGRGRVVKGAVADLVMFAPDEVGEVGTYADPVHPPHGIAAVILGGMPVVADGVWLGRRRGVRLHPRP